jgi:large subunit ribosomal protein L16
MTLRPRQQKFKKQQKGKSFNKISTILTLNNLPLGSLGLKTMNAGRLNAQQIQTMVKSITKIIKKTGRLILKVFPHTPISKKPIEVRMGKGKGTVDHFIAKVKAGCILCEIETTSKGLALRALQLAQIRLPLKTKILSSN